MTSYRLINSDCRTELALMDDNSIDSIVTDPPYELGFMGKSWDATGIAYDVKLWAECLRVLKPGGHLLAFGGSRTYHRMACAIEDAGFEVRDQIMWVYGSGFPKSLDVFKAIDKAAGAKREIVGSVRTNVGIQGGNFSVGSKTADVPITAPATSEAQRWQGWGTALKPAHEPIVLARKPLVGTVAANVLEWGVGGLNIDGCRIPSDDGFEKAWDKPVSTNIGAGTYISDGKQHVVDISSNKPSGRWPANFIHDGSEEVLELFPDTAGGARPAKANKPSGEHYEGGWGPIASGDRIEFAGGSAARFFYCAKASRTERNTGLDDLQPQRESDRNNDQGIGGDNPRNRTNTPQLNHHPTVKPVALMRHLIKLVTPPNGTILDPFTGSGTTGVAATLEHFNFIGIEQNTDYITIAHKRIQHTESHQQ